MWVTVLLGEVGSCFVVSKLPLRTRRGQREEISSAPRPEQLKRALWKTTKFM